MQEANINVVRLPTHFTALNERIVFSQKKSSEAVKVIVTYKNALRDLERAKLAKYEDWLHWNSDGSPHTSYTYKDGVKYSSPDIKIDDYDEADEGDEGDE